MPSRIVDVRLSRSSTGLVIPYDYIERGKITLHMKPHYPIFRLVDDFHVFHETSSWNYEREVDDERDQNYGGRLHIQANGKKARLKGRTQKDVDVLFDLVVTDDHSHPLVQSEIEDVKLAEEEAKQKGATGDFRSMILDGFAPLEHPSHGGGRLRF